MHIYHCTHCGSRKICAITGCRGQLCVPMCVKCLRGQFTRAQEKDRQLTTPREPEK